MSRKPWTKQTVIDAILRHQKSGWPLSRAWKEDKPLFRAAVRNFGNWQNALRAAGLNPKPRRRWTEERVVQELLAWHRQPWSANVRRDDPALAGAASRMFGSIEKAFETLGLEPKHNRWTDRRVIETIQNYYVQGRSIDINGCGDKKLFAAAKRRFGTWAKAVAAAGLSAKYSPPAPVRAWTKQDVLDAITKWHEDGRPISNVCKQDQGLYSAAKKHFGTWRQAVMAAGLQPTRKQWTPQLVIEEIRRRHERGLPLNSVVFKQDAPLAGAATRLLGGWRKAVMAAGITSRVSTPVQARKAG